MWTGTIEEEAGIDDNPTTQAGDRVMSSLLKMIPSLGDAQLVHQTACLRPVAKDNHLVLSSVPGLNRIYIATGTRRKGILLGSAVWKITADLVIKGTTEIPIEKFSPARFI